METTKLATEITRFTVTHWRSEIQHCNTNGRAFWGNNLILSGNSSGNHNVVKCIISFNRNFKEQLPLYRPESKTIELHFPYDQYFTILHYFQTTKGIEVKYDDTRPDNNIYAFLVNKDTSVLG